MCNKNQDIMSFLVEDMVNEFENFKNQILLDKSIVHQMKDNLMIQSKI